jgi:GT2 family glycosyltransferase
VVIASSPQGGSVTIDPDQAAPEGARILLVVPTLGKRIDYLAQTLISVQSQGVAIDVVAVLPPGAHEARELLAGHNVSVLDDPGSLSGAVNAGLATASGRHIYGNWIGDDDLLAPGSLAATSSALDRHSAAALAYGQCTYIDESGGQLWVNKAGRKAVWLLPWGPDLIPQPGMLFRLADFRAVGGLDETLEFAMDLDLLLRLRSRGKFIDVGRPVSSFRWHSKSITVSDRAASLAESERVKHRYLPGALRVAAPLWDVPVRLATHLAARRVGARVTTLAAQSPPNKGH